MIDIQLEHCLVEDFQAHQYIGSCEYGVKGTSMIMKSNLAIWLVGLKCD